MHAPAEADLVAAWDAGEGSYSIIGHAPRDGRWFSDLGGGAGDGGPPAPMGACDLFVHLAGRLWSLEVLTAGHLAAVNTLRAAHGGMGADLDAGPEPLVVPDAVLDDEAALFAWLDGAPGTVVVPHLDLLSEDDEG